MMDIALPRTTRLSTETKIIQRKFVVLELGAAMALDVAAAAPPAAAAFTASGSLAVAVKAAVTAFWTFWTFGAGGT
jgi:hypothetical protein